MFEPGRVILHRGFVGDRLVFLRTARVIAHDQQGLRLWIQNATPAALSVAMDGRTIRDMDFHEWLELAQELRPTRWWGPSLMMWIPPDSWHSVWWFWEPGGKSFAGWYINLEEPTVAWDDGEVAGVDTTDQDLDVWVYPDRSWEWKDEDEFLERLAFPEHYWVPDEGKVRAEGERVLGLVEAGVFPFDGTWCDFRPDPAWTWPAELPEGWQRDRAIAI